MSKKYSIISYEKKYLAIVFDLFHTLTGKEPKLDFYLRDKTVFEFSYEVWKELLFANSEERLCGITCDPKIMISDILSTFKIEVNNEILAKIIEIRYQYFSELLHNIPNENILSLEKLASKWYALGLISNADVMEIRDWKNTTLSNLFDSSIFSCNVGYSKPNLKIFEIVLEQLKLKPKEVIFVGDGGSQELHIAKQLGMYTIFMKGIIEHTKPEVIQERTLLAHKTIEKISDLIAIIEETENE